MPPSGYSRLQSQFVIDFLESCFRALVIEAKEKELSLCQALSMEIANIHTHLSSCVSLTSQDAILRLTLSFYEALTNSNTSSDIEIIQLSSIYARKIGDEILNIKVKEYTFTNT